MRRKFILAAIIVIIWLPGLVHAQDPTPFPTIDAGELPTQTLTVTPPEDAIWDLIPVEHSSGITLNLDVGLWDYDLFEGIVRVGNTVKSVANPYHAFDILFGFAVLAIAIGPIVAFIRKRGDRD